MQANVKAKCQDPARGAWLGAYELGLLEPAEAALFEAHLQECAACADRLYELAPYTDALQSDPGQLRRRVARAQRARSSLRDRLREWVRSIGEFLAPPRVHLPAAVAAVAAIVLLVFLSPSGPAGLRGLVQLEPLPYVPIETRAAPAASPERLYADGMALYSAADYEGAARLLKESLSAAERAGGWSGGDQARLYLGISLVLTGRAAEADVPLEANLSSPIRLLAERSRWYLAQSALLQENPEAALRHLEILAAGSGPYRERAAWQVEKLQSVMSSIGPED